MPLWPSSLELACGVGPVGMASARGNGAVQNSWVSPDQRGTPPEKQTVASATAKKARREIKGHEGA